MYICPRCNTQSEVPANFCPTCGAAMVMAATQQPDAPEQTAVQQTTPSYNPTTYTYPPYQQPANRPSKAKAIVSMSLSAAGLLFAFLGFIYTSIFMAVEPEAGLVMAIVFGIFSLPLSIIGLCMASSVRRAGDTTVFSKLGRIFGIIGIIMAGLSMFIGFIGIADA